MGNRFSNEVNNNRTNEHTRTNECDNILSRQLHTTTMTTDECAYAHFYSQILRYQERKSHKESRLTSWGHCIGNIRQRKKNKHQQQWP